MNWLITGGCGFIGTSLARHLLEGEHSIRVVDNLSVGQKSDLDQVGRFSEYDPDGRIPSMEVGPASHRRRELLVGDILDASLAVRASAGADVIVHLAANAGVAASLADPRTDCMSNVVGTLNYLEACRVNRIGRFVFASSGAPIGECAPPIHEELAAHPVSPYGASKLAGEGYCSAYFRSFGIDTVALRFGNVYGPGSGRKNSAVAKFIAEALQGRELEIYGDGAQTRDFIYIDDLLGAITLGATRPGIGGEVFQIATNSETSVSELARLLCQAFARRGISVPKVILGPSRPGDVRRNLSDTSKAARVLGWKPQTSLAEGLEKTLTWFSEWKASGN